MLFLCCFIRRNAVATKLVTLSEPARTWRNNKPLFSQHKMHTAARLRMPANRYTRADADLDRALEAPNLFLARPWTSTSGCRDDIYRGGHFWVSILARFRGWNDLARIGGRSRRTPALAGDERRLHLYTRVIRRLDDPSASNSRRQTTAFETDRRPDCAAPCILYSSEYGHLDGDA